MESVGDWDWPDLFNRRRPAGVSSLPDDGVDGPQDLDGGSAAADAPARADRKSGRRTSSRGAGAGAGESRPARGEPIRNLDESASGSSSTAAASSEPAASPAVLAQADALRRAAVRGSAFCEE